MGMFILNILIGMLFSALCIFSISLVRYLKQMDCGVCDACENKRNCIAWKSCCRGKNVYWNEWMLVTSVRLYGRCKYSISPCLKDGIGLYFLSIITYLFSYWSCENRVSGVLYGITGIALLFLAIVDWYTQYIPLECNILIFLCGLIHLYTNFSNWLDYIIGLFAVSGFLLLLDRISTPVLKKQYGEDVDQVIGDGDIKLMAATGLLLGWKLNFIALGIGCVMGSVIHLILMKIKGSGHRLAFGPYLSLGVYITMICGEQLVSWYLNFLGVKPL